MLLQMPKAIFFFNSAPSLHKTSIPRLLYSPSFDRRQKHFDCCPLIHIKDTKTLESVSASVAWMGNVVWIHLLEESYQSLNLGKGKTAKTFFSRQTCFWDREVGFITVGLLFLAWLLVPHRFNLEINSFFMKSTAKLQCALLPKKLRNGRHLLKFLPLWKCRHGRSGRVTI